MSNSLKQGDLDALAARVGEQLGRRQWMLVTAESCTGGLVAAAITAVAGSSAWFERGYVTYSNASKSEVLGIPRALLDQYGAVSMETARAMADGALSASRAQFALSITGIAGPGGGSADKPVGTVCFGWAAQGLATTTETCRFAGDRGAVRHLSVVHALQGVLARL